MMRLTDADAKRIMDANAALKEAEAYAGAVFEDTMSQARKRAQAKFERSVRGARERYEAAVAAAVPVND